MRDIRFLFTLCFLCLSCPVFGYYPSTLWSSKKIPETLIGVKVGSVTGPGRREIIALFPGGFSIYNRVENDLAELFDYRAHPAHRLFKLNLLDVDQDGRDEIILSRFHLGRVESVVGKIDEQGFRILAETSGFLNVIFWKGERRLFLQKSYGDDDYSGPLYEMGLVGNKLEKKGELRLPGGLSGKTMSLYSIFGFEMQNEPPAFLHLNPAGKIILFQIFHKFSEKYVRKWTSGEDYGGPVFFYDREVRDVLNRMADRRFYIPLEMQVSQSRASPSLATTRPATPLLGPVGAWLKLPPEPAPYQDVEHKKEEALYVLVAKNTPYLKNVVGAYPSIKNTQMVRLAWSGYGFQEEWNSPRLDGAITDFVLVDWDGDGREEILAAFLLRDRGYWDTLSRRDSLLIVLKPQ